MNDDKKKSISLKYYKRFQMKLYALSLIFTLSSYQANAQQAFTSEDDMRDIFIAGGYGALFGATMGTAILPFLSGSPISNIRVVAG